MERQVHGLIYEDIIFNRFPNINKSKKYTAKWDGICKYSNIPISIKTRRIGSTTIEMGDIVRQSNIKQDYILCIGFWDYNNQHEKTFIKEKIFRIPKEFHTNNLKKEDIEYQKTIFNNIPINTERDKKLDNEWKKRRLIYKQAWKNTKSKFLIRYKKDYKRTTTNTMFN